MDDLKYCMILRHLTGILLKYICSVMSVFLNVLICSFFQVLSTFILPFFPFIYFMFLLLLPLCHFKADSLNLSLPASFCFSPFCWCSLASDEVNFSLHMPRCRGFWEGEFCFKRNTGVFPLMPHPHCVNCITVCLCITCHGTNRLVSSSVWVTVQHCYLTDSQVSHMGLNFSWMYTMVQKFGVIKVFFFSVKIH